MTPSRWSRYRFSIASTDPDGGLALSERPMFTYRDLSDTIQHPIVEGDTLWTIAGFYYAGLPRPSGLYWVLADFQPQPIYDPTIRLVAGNILFVPSLRTVQEQILSDRRLSEPQVDE